MSILPTIPANVFTISAGAIGYILIDELTPGEQNSLGNWFMLIGQVLTTNASQQQVINNYNKVTTDHLFSDTTENQVIMMQKVIDAINKEIDGLKK